MSQIPDWADHVGAGWQGLLARLHAELLNVAPTYTAVQVKEKFGGLRVYFTAPAEAYEQAGALVRAAEEESFKTCESCGQPGWPGRRGERGWTKTLCGACRPAEWEPL